MAPGDAIGPEGREGADLVCQRRVGDVLCDHHRLAQKSTVPIRSTKPSENPGVVDVRA